MKILYVVSDLGTTSETFVDQLLFGLSELGHEITVASRTLSPRHREKFAHEPITLNLPRDIEERFLLKLHPRWGAAINRYRAQRAAQKASARLTSAIASCQPDAIYIEYFCLGLPLVNALAKYNGRVVTHCHGYDITSALASRAARDRIEPFINCVDRFIVASDHMRRRAMLHGVPENKIVKVKLGVELKGVHPIPWEERLKNNYLVSLGRLTSKKDPRPILFALKRLLPEFPDLRYCIVGDGPLMPEFRRTVEALGLAPHVDIQGALPHVEALQVVNGARVYVQHSATGMDGDQEGFGISIAEASLLGLPVVSTYHNGIPEQVVHGETGLLAPEHDFEMMADHIAKILDHRDYAQQMGSRGNARIAGSFSVSVRIHKINDLLTEEASI